ncbi:MAG: DUF5990 family protein [Opitutaceae bacterium]
MPFLPTNIAVEVRCTRLPPVWEGEPIYLAIQNGREVVNITPAKLGRAIFKPEFRLAEANGAPNFLGPYAQGPRDERFFYLSWGKGGTAADFQMFRRLKVHLSHLQWKQIVSAAERGVPLRVTIDATDRCGGPLCASAWPDNPAVEWLLT